MSTANLPAPNGPPKVSPLVVMARRFDIEPARLLEVLRATVIRPDKSGRVATNEEIAAFTIVANEYGLSPFTREIHAFVGQSGAVVPIVGIDGWTKLVNRHQEFDGCEFEELSDEEGHAVATTCIMYVRGRTHPVKVTEWLAECRRNTPPWNTMPRRMLRHKAYMQAARLCFGLSGIYDEDEARDAAGLAPRRRATEAEMQAFNEAADAKLAAAPPTGRVSLRRPKPAPAPPPTEPETMQADRLQPDPDDIQITEEPVPEEPVLSADEDQMARLDIVHDLRDAIASARTLEELRAAGVRLRKDRELIGEAQYQELLRDYQPRYRELDQPAAK